MAPEALDARFVKHATRTIELAPKYWVKTVAGLDSRHRAILTRPWETADAVTEIAATLVRAA